MPPNTIPSQPLTGWRITRKTDTKENLVNAIAAEATIPAEAIAFLCARINASPKNILRVDAHCTIVGDKEVYSLAITPI